MCSKNVFRRKAKVSHSFSQQLQCRKLVGIFCSSFIFDQGVRFQGLLIGHLEISASKSRHQRRHWHWHLHRHCKKFVLRKQNLNALACAQSLASILPWEHGTTLLQISISPPIYLLFIHHRCTLLFQNKGCLNFRKHLPLPFRKNSAPKTFENEPVKRS